ncbi:MlaD family protein [Amycolatopsis thermoflava]|uniref:MlaD family protein n=1 Tax=Amycolatopsis thermoflava TaxID=84480 RepID=UPI00381E7CD7
MSNRILRRLRTGVVLAAVAAGAAAGVTAINTSQDGDVTLVAMFADANPLIPGNVVKAGGVTVGTIRSISLEKGQARVEMGLDRSVLPLHTDAKATITTQDLLGERFIKLEKGSPNAPVLGDGAVLAAKQTNRVVDLQDVLNAVDTPTSTALAALLSSTGEGLDGKGKQAADALAVLEPAMRRAGDLAALLDDQNALLTGLVDKATPVAEALASGGGADLDRLVASATGTLSTVAANRQAVQDSLTRLPSTLASARATLAELTGAADPATRTLASLRPVTDDLTDISGELQRFADAADPALAALPPVLQRADLLLDEAAPLVKTLRPATADLTGVSSSARTLSEQALSLRLNNLMEFVKGWSMATSDYDAISHYFKASIPLSPKALGHLAAGLVPPLPDEPVDVPLPGLPELPLPGKGEAPALPAGPVLPASPGDSATGLTEHQENSMVEQLLGGLLSS